MSSIGTLGNNRGSTSFPYSSDGTTLENNPDSGIESQQLEEIEKGNKLKVDQSNKERVNGDESDDEGDEKKKPSKIKQATAMVVSFSATVTSTYLNAHPIIIVGLASLFGSAGKSVMRNVPRKLRYSLVTAVATAGFVADYYMPVKLYLGPIMSSLVIACLSRSQKLYIIGKSPKDK